MSAKGGADKRVRNPTIALSPETKKRLDILKVVKEETYDHVIANLLDQLKGPPTMGAP